MAAKVKVDDRLSALRARHRFRRNSLDDGRVSDVCETRFKSNLGSRPRLAMLPADKSMERPNKKLDNSKEATQLGFCDAGII